MNENDPRRKRARGHRWILFGLALGFACTCAPRANLRSAKPEFDPINYAFATYVGSGIYSNGERSVWLIRIKGSYRVRKEERDPFGLRVTFNATLGFYDYSVEDILEFDFPDSIGTVGFVPGVEFRLPLRDNWTFMPFLDLGMATDTQAEQTTLVIGIGIRSRAEFPWKARTNLLWNELLYAENRTTDLTFESNFSAFSTRFEVRQPLTTVKGRMTDLGAYAKLEWFFNDVEINRPFREPLRIRERYELGFTWGTAERWRIAGISMPRIGFGYRFGQGIEAVRFVLSFAY